MSAGRLSTDTTVEHLPEFSIKVLLNDRLAPVNLEAYSIPVLRWRVEGELPFRVGSLRMHVAVSASLDVSDNGLLWRSESIPFSGSGQIRLHDIPMGPSRRYWAVVVLEDGLQVVATSAPMTFGTGPGTRWSAQPIWATASARDENPPDWAFLRTSIRLPDRPIRWATLSVTASSTAPSRQFVYRIWLNSEFLGCGPVFPVRNEVRYDGYDVTSQLRSGEVNAIGVIAYTREDHRFAAQLDVCFADGELRHYGSDQSWKGKDGSCAFPESGSIGTQYYMAPVENIRSEAYPDDLSDPAIDDGSWTSAEIRPEFQEYLASPVDAPRVVPVHPVDVQMVGRNSVVLDFGRVLMGGMQLDIDLVRPVTLKIRYGEVKENSCHVKYHLNTSNTYADDWHLKAGHNRIETWGIRVFRYVELIGDLSSLDAVVGAIGAAGLSTPVNDPHASFDSSDPVLNAVWNLSRDTILGLNGNMYVDSWTRERAPYEADAWIQQSAHLALDDAPALGRYSLEYLIRNRTWPTEWPLYSILAVHDSWMQTGDLDQACRLYGELCSLLPNQYLDRQSCLVVKDPGESSRLDGDLVDWPPTERDGFVFGHVNTIVNALSSQAYRDMSELARALGHNGDAKAMADISAAMRVAIDRYLYDPELGAYVDGLDSGPHGKQIGHHSLHASAFSLAFADPSREHAISSGKYLRRRGMRCSVYTAVVYLQGLYKQGMGADADSLLGAETGTHTWKHMIDQGAGGTMEAWDPAIKPNTTYSHPWAASPLHLLAEGLIGIKPIEPGFRYFACIPQPGMIRDAAIVMPTCRGDIHATYSLHGAVHSDQGSTQTEGIRLSLTVPAGSGATVVLPRLIGQPQGRSVDVELDGSRRGARLLGENEVVAGVHCPVGCIIFEGLLPGNHVITAGLV